MKKVGDKVDSYLKDIKGGRITGYSFAIMWSAVFFVLFNFYNQYIAYYHYEEGIWHRYPLLTESFNQWFPIVSLALVASMIGNILLIVYDGYFFRRLIRIILNLFGLSAVITLLTIFPFDFTVFPVDLTGILNPIIIVVLILIIIGMIIDTMVKAFKLIFSTGRSY